MSESVTAVAVPGAPAAAQMDRLAGVMAPLARVVQPTVTGVERLPRRGALYVGNHTLYAFLDLPFMMSELWTRRGIRLRGLGDHGHYAIPIWRDLLELCGMVRGTRENVRALMEAGEDVLVFPGGANEVFKERGQKYELLWKERLGFARLAIEFGYPIVPFAAVGAEEMLDVVVDSKTPGVGQVSSLMRRLVGVPMPPLARGVGLTPIPRPERLYFWLGEAIETDGVGEDEAEVRALRDRVKSAVEGGIDTLHARRDADPRRSLVTRLRGWEADSSPADLVGKAFESWNVSGSEGAAAWLSKSVVLEDPPDWPDRDTWRGRDAALRRLEEVTKSLGAGWAEPVNLEAAGSDVVGQMVLRGAENKSPLGGFGFVAKVEGEQIGRIRVFADISEAKSAVARG